ncbi:hypothetical protein [Acetobacter nitrogenifigens]|uniref:hypothetical protein n=1 Tax=Acetobacter nitrogenifigens TaxID=285268 RepID=UPI00137658AE|nr:hypothetical protein [Acetobacter nitrogenifigens]
MTRGQGDGPQRGTRAGISRSPGITLMLRVGAGRRATQASRSASVRISACVVASERLTI